jgi:hypothetical protein
LKNSRGDKTAIELFVAGVRGWEAGLRRRMEDGWLWVMRRLAQMEVRLLQWVHGQITVVMLNCDVSAMGNKQVQGGELGFEPKTVDLRWHSSRMAFTSQAIETPRVDGKLRFNRIVRMLQSYGQCCPQFAPISTRA